MDTYLRDRIENITERDFWTAVRPVPGLKAAVAAGRSGRRVAAYELMGEYHAGSLRADADAYRAQLEPLRAKPERLRDIRQRADRVLRHDIQGWHTHRRQFGRVIDFNADFGRSGQYGFHYLGWLAPVVQQYALTGERRCRDGFIEIISQYYDQRAKIVRRIPSLHPVYYELGAHAKANVILPAYALLTGDPEVGPDVREAMLKLLLGFARSLYRLQKGGFRAGNWQIVGSATLFTLGACFPEFREAAAWRARGEEMLAEHARRDFFSDGGHGERCWGYGVMSLNGIVSFYRAALRHGFLDRRRKATWTGFIKRAYRWYAASTTPSGHTLNYGDGTIDRAQSIFDAAFNLFPAMQKEPGLMGVDRARSNILRASGYAFMRGGNRPGDPFMSINFGRHGGGHTHADLLSFTLWRYGQPLIEEVGRFGSYDNPLDPLFRSPQAHNQIVLEHVPMNRPAHAGRDVLWHSTDRVDMFSAWHGAFAPARIRRQIVFVKPAYWVVVDVVTAGEYIFQAASYLHGVRPFRLVGPGVARLDGRPGCLVAFASPGELRRLETGIDYTREDSREAVKGGLVFGEERHRLVALKWRDISDPRPVVFATLLAPFEKTPPRMAIESESVRGDASGQAAAVAVKHPGGTDLLVFNPAGAAVRAQGRTVRAPMAVLTADGRWHRAP